MSQLTGISGVEQEYPSLCIHHFFEKQVKRTPDAVAIQDGADVLTYRELDEKSNRLARHLQEKGVTTETIVGCYLTRSSSIVLWMLAILKAGGMYLLLDPQLPDKRLGFMVEDANPLLILADKPLVLSIHNKDVSVLNTDDIEQQSQILDDAPVTSHSQPYNAAYITYTSGSTGRPKGVIITHDAIVNHSYYFAKQFNLTKSDRVPLMASITFDMATEEILPPLMSGCRLILSASEHSDIEAFDKEIRDRAYTILNVPAPLWHAWTEYLKNNQLTVPSCLRLVIAGSDKINTKQFMTWKELPGASNVQWVAAYGTTETTVTSSFYTTAWDDDLIGEPIVPIGKPIANTTFHVLDEEMKPVPQGEVGELYIGGHGLARGYHNLPNKTKSSFLPDPFSDKEESRLYKTGDLARFFPDGTAVCIGRQDSQIKINGLRIELGEIESVINEHPLVKESVVVLDQGDDHEESKQLIAFVASGDNDDHSILNKMAGYVREHLHPHMIPERFVLLPKLPININGKCDRSALEKHAATLRM